MNTFIERLLDLFREGGVEILLRDIHRPCQYVIRLDDFCQEVLLRAVLHQHSFRGQDRSQLIAWLRSIAKQLMITQLRLSRTANFAPLPDYLASSEEAPLARLEKQERLGWLITTLNSLDPADRDLLIRHYYLGESFVEIARKTGEMPNTIIKRHIRLLDRLRKLREF